MKKTFILFGIFLTLLIFGCTQPPIVPDQPKSPGLENPVNPGSGTTNTFTPIELPVTGQLSELPKFESCGDIAKAFAGSSSRGGYGYAKGMVVEESASIDSGTQAQAPSDYSTTNVQVEGVDEADFVKSDGQYLYIVSRNNLIIAKAFPADQAEVLFKQELENFSPQDMFIDNDTLALFGSSYLEVPEPEPIPLNGVLSSSIAMPRPYYSRSFTTVQLWNIADRTQPSLVRSLDFEGSYLSSRKVGDYAYFVIQTYPDYRWTQLFSLAQELNVPLPELNVDFLPLFRDRTDPTKVEDLNRAFTRTTSCGQVGYLPPVKFENFITLASVSMNNLTEEIQRETIVASGENVYASPTNLYLAEVVIDNNWAAGLSPEEIYVSTPDPRLMEKTVVHKFALDNGSIEYKGFGRAPGHILNQFSMDEYDNHFRIATTIGEVWDNYPPSANNVYIFNADMNQVGSLTNIAPGEKIYSIRFMGAKGYMVTFKKVDPFFVLDLSDPTNPLILGKLKIPGYSDYLHPFDETHIIGIGKEAIDASEEETGSRNLDFAWYQGVKMAIFDVTDVANPKEMWKVTIGDRGTDSYALNDHKAFLFDREKQLLVIPILLAQLTDEQKNLPSNERASTYGDYSFQGAFVYNVTLENGFQEKGRITHVDDPQAFMKAGYYYWGDGTDVKRSGYMDDVLYTLSDRKILFNNLTDLSLVKQLTLFEPEEQPTYDYYIQ